MLISAWQGGYGAGLFATILIECIAVFTLRYLEPDWSTRKLVELISFFLAGLVITGPRRVLLRCAEAGRGQSAMALRRPEQHRGRGHRH